MRATSKNENIKNLDKICVDTNELMSLLSCGRVTAVQIGGQAGARIEIGKDCFGIFQRFKSILMQ